MAPAVPHGSRTSIRRSVEIPCELVSARNDEALCYQATDLSTSGIWLQTARPFRTGETVCICFRPDDQKQIMVFGEVARVATQRNANDQTPGIGMGIEFLDLTPRERLRLTTYLASRRGPVPRRRRPVSLKPLPTSVRKSCWR